MPRIAGTSDRQSAFLRAFRTQPRGPEPDQWPTPAILRRWLRKPGFVRALQTVLHALRFQADFHLAAAATHAASQIPITTGSSTHDLERLLRIAHLRQRFPAPNTPAQDSTQDSKALPDQDESPVSSVWCDILNDPERLGAYIRLSVRRGDARYEQFLNPAPSLDTPLPTVILPDSSPAAQQPLAHVPR